MVFMTDGTLVTESMTSKGVEDFRAAQAARRQKEVRPIKSDDISERSQIYHSMKEVA